ncbi:hypothetical protein RAS2_29140 [Phycisphaerae bacterium RAS2]|nr:hypothetical protein RAS2_29140 [Phycisphaerae bacterium RAS2]
MAQQFAGSRWWKFDFHTHTPASRDTPWFRAVGGADAVTPESWLQKFMDAGVDCVAVTDHNSGDWIDTLRTAYEGMKAAGGVDFRELFLFPGVEITVNNGIHVLAIFDTTKTKADIDGLLGQVDYTGTKGDSDGCTRKSVIEVIDVVATAGGLVLPAHADKDKGLLQVQAGNPNRAVLDAHTLRQVLKSQRVFAMELVDRNAARPAIYGEEGCQWTEVLGCDCHNFRNGAQPGEWFTWVKMGTPSLEGVRLALLDGAPLSIIRSDVADGDPNKYAGLVIDEVVVENARFAGRDGPLRVRFSPWLTTLIGGRGSGKSTVIELLRLALRREGDLPEELREWFRTFAQVPAQRTDRGALTNETTVSVVLRKDTGRFRVNWRQNGAGHVIEEELADGRWTEAPGDVRTRFPSRVFSQKHIFALSSDPDSLLRLIDEAPEIDHAEWTREWKSAEARFLALRGQRRELEGKIADRPRLEGELADIRRQLEVFERGGHREVLQRFQRARRQRRALDERAEELAKNEGILRETAEQLTPSDIREDEFDSADAAEASAMSLLQEAAEQQRLLATRVAALADEIRAFTTDWSTRRDATAWAAREREVVREHEELVARLQAEGIADPAAFATLVQRRQGLERQLQELNSIRDRANELSNQANAALTRLGELRRDLSERRSRFLSNVLANNSFVRMHLIPFGETSRVAEPSFRSHLCREDGRLADDVLSEDRSRGILVELYQGLPADAIQRATNLAERIENAKRALSSAAGGASLEGRTQWLVNHLRGLRPEQIDRLQLWWPEDELRVEYRRGRGADDFVPIEQGSPGQKSAAILAFILSYGAEPIVLDQPEDDLDNHLIYDLIVQQIRENKRKRQVIVATHNPNIVVNGDAEMVVVLDHRGGQCRLIEDGTGCLQEREVREEICRVMEGGRQAFVQRYRRILEEVDSV